MVVVLAALAGGALGAGVGELVLLWAGGGRRAPAAADAWRPQAGAGLGLLGVLLRLSRHVGRGPGRRLPIPGDAVGRLDAAGLSPRVGPADVRAVRGTGVAVGGALVVVGAPVLGPRAVVLAVVWSVALVLLPDLLIGRRIRRRGEEMLSELPDVVDLLRIALRSGRSVPETVARVGAYHPGALGAELRRTAAEMRIGVATDRALLLLGRRCPTEGSAELVALLLRTHRHGGSAAEGLRALAEDLRSRRARAAIDRASRAAPKIQLVVALLLVPAAMLLIAAGLLQMRG